MQLWRLNLLIRKVKIVNKKNIVKKGSLGRGLSSLLGESQKNVEKLLLDDEDVKLNKIPIELIKPGSWQARKYFDKEDLRKLSVSIKDQGVIQPIVITHDKSNEGKYLIIAGERRWRAAQLAKLHSIPVIIKQKITEAKINEISLLENLQRSDLNPIEEAQGFQNLINTFNYSQEKIASIVGKSRPYITNIIRLLLLPEKIQEILIKNKLSIGHVRPLIGRKDAILLVNEILKKNLNVREVESFIKFHDNPVKKQSFFVENKDIEKILSDKLGIKTRIKFNKETEKGSISLICNNLDEFDFIIKKIKSF